MENPTFSSRDWLFAEPFTQLSHQSLTSNGSQWCLCLLPMKISIWVPNRNKSLKTWLQFCNSLFPGLELLQSEHFPGSRIELEALCNPVLKSWGNANLYARSLLNTMAACLWATSSRKFTQGEVASQCCLSLCKHRTMLVGNCQLFLWTFQPWKLSLVKVKD